VRKLATIQRIKNLTPIKKADRIELAYILGWECVVKKGEFKINDYCVYFEVDSILPEKEVFEFMRPRKFKVKTAKFRKQISQGLALPISILDKNIVIKEGMDLTTILNITKYDPEKIKECKRSKSKNIFVNYMMKYKIFRKCYLFIFPKLKGCFPDFIPKTDEERLQNIPNIIEKNNGENFYCMEKLDGQSLTVFYNNKLNKWYKPWINNAFGVCSRNIWRKRKDMSNWWFVVKNLDIERKLKKYCKQTKTNLAIQGEIIGPNIQNNRYNIKQKQLHIFSIFNIDTQKYLNFHDKSHVIHQLGLTEVPFYNIIQFNTSIHTVKWFTERTNKKSKINNEVLMEGLVYRSIKNDDISFKVINPNFLLKYNL